jgi:hypothetical protein
LGHIDCVSFEFSFQGESFAASELAKARNEKALHGRAWVDHRLGDEREQMPDQ